MWRKSRYSDVIHNHSLWSMVNVAAGWVVPGHCAKLVVSPRGTLSPWALSRSNAAKGLLWPLQRRALEKAQLLHATSDSELGQIRALQFSAPVAVIPNGVDLPEDQRKVPCDARTLLFLGRIHPTKCVDRLLHAWHVLHETHPNWRLLVAGPGDPSYVKFLKDLAESLTLKRIRFTGPLYGRDKFLAYSSAELFVLPSHSENFGMSVAEALAHSCPAVVSQGAPWAGLETEGCGWWIDHATSSLTHTLDEAMRRSPVELAKMGRRGREWMARDFAWDVVAQRMEQAYEWILGSNGRPEFIHVE